MSHKRTYAKSQVKHIEEVVEAFNGVRRYLIALCDAHPDIAAEWCHKKNAGWGSEDLSRGSGTKVWWTCKNCSKNYKATISSRTSNKSGCPYCAHHIVSEKNSLMLNYPDLAAEWHPTLNVSLKLSDMMYGSSKEVYWLCGKCNHTWKIEVCARTLIGSGCPTCYQQKLLDNRQNIPRGRHNNIVLTEDSTPELFYYNISPRSKKISLFDFDPQLAQQWHPYKNGSVTPHDISKGSDALAWWKCHVAPDHEWQTPVVYRTTNKHGCPFCTNYRLTESNSLASKAPYLALQMHPTKNGNLKATDIVAGSHKKLWWQCFKHECHIWEASIVDRLRGRGCACCHGTQISETNSLVHNFPDIVAQIHPTKNPDLAVEKLSYGSKKKLWWQCLKDPEHAWQAAIHHRVLGNAKCPICRENMTGK